MIITCAEPEIQFAIECKEVAPTQKEQQQAGGRDCYTVQQYVDTYGGTFQWVEVVEVLIKPKANMNEEDEDFPAPVMYELAIPYCVVGTRFPILSDGAVWFIDQGDVSCRVYVVEVREL